MESQQDDTSGQGAPAARQSLCSGPDLCMYSSLVPFPALLAGLVCGASLCICACDEHSHKFKSFLAGLQGENN